MADNEGVSDGQQDLRRSTASGSVSVFTPITHPVLKSVDPVKVAEFMRDRKRYEIEIAEKKKEVPSLTKASFKVSIDQGLLRRMHFLGPLDEVAPGKEVDALTSTDIQKFIKSLIEKDEIVFDPNIIEKSMKGLKMSISIADPGARVLEYANDFFTRLESVGYDSFKDKNPKKTVKLLQKYVTPRGLKEVMRRALEYREELQEDVKLYVKVLCEETTSHDKYFFADTTNKTDEKTGYTERNDNRKSSAGTANQKKNHDRAGKKKQKQERRPPLCLNPTHAAEGKRCYMKDCDITSPEEAERLLQEYKAKKANGGKGGAKKVKDDQGTDESQANSTLFMATFAKLVQRILCADGGSDINLMPPDLFEELCERDAVMSVKIFNEPRRYSMAAKETPDGANMYVECDRQVTLNVELFIRHGLYLQLRNLTWYVATSAATEPLLGRPTMEALEINTRELLAAATDRMGNSINMGELMPSEEYPQGTVARRLQEGIYHGDGGIEGTEKTEEQDWLDLGQDLMEEKKVVIDNLIKEADPNGISEQARDRLVV